MESNDPVAAEIAKSATQGYLPFDPGVLVPGMPRPFAIYERTGSMMVLLCDRLVQISNHATARLFRGDQPLYVRAEQGPLLSTYTESTLSSAIARDDLSQSRRLHILESCARTVMADVLSDPAAPGAVGRCRALAGSIVDFSMDSPAAVQSLSSLAGKDYYTFTHCVHVCMYSVALYRHMVAVNKEQLCRLGLGAMLHDVGKSMVRAEVLNKPGRLTPAEFEEMSSHTILGWQVLQGHGVSDAVVRDAVLSHHERLDGRGYPSGLADERVSQAARIVAIADVYDAMTTVRSYRGAMSHEQAVEIMFSQMTGSHLDGNLVDMFEGLVRPRHATGADATTTE